MKTRNIVIAGILIALTFVLTFAIKVPVPFTRGYVHLGDSIIFIASILFGWKVGALVGGLGSALADLVGGYAFWAIPTLIIKSIMGALVGLISYNYRKKYSLKNEIFIFSISVSVWIVFMLSISLFLGNLIENLANTSLAQTLIEELGYENIEELSSFLLQVRSLINIVLIVIPLALTIFSLTLRKRDLKLFNLGNMMGSVVAGLWMVVGYFLAGRLILGNWVIPIFEIPWNVMQFSLGMIVAYIVLLGLQKTNIK